MPNDELENNYLITGVSLVTEDDYTAFDIDVQYANDGDKVFHATIDDKDDVAEIFNAMVAAAPYGEVPLGIILRDIVTDWNDNLGDTLYQLTH